MPAAEVRREACNEPIDAARMGLSRCAASPTPSRLIDARRRDRPPHDAATTAPACSATSGRVSDASTARIRDRAAGRALLHAGARPGRQHLDPRRPAEAALNAENTAADGCSSPSTTCAPRDAATSTSRRRCSPNSRLVGSPRGHRQHGREDGRRRRRRSGETGRQPPLPPAPAPAPTASSTRASKTPRQPASRVAGRRAASAPTRPPSHRTPGRTGAVAEKVTVTGYTDGDAKVLPTFDLGGCAPTVTAGQDLLVAGLVHLDTRHPDSRSMCATPRAAGSTGHVERLVRRRATLHAGRVDRRPPSRPASRAQLRPEHLRQRQITTDDYALYDSVGAPSVPGTLVAGTPTITGTAKVGETLTANPGTSTPASTTFTYQWLRGATDIAGATSATYTATAADRGAQLSVRVTGSAPDWTPPTATATSAATSAVLAGNVTTNRLAGADRFGTAIAVAQTFAPGVARLYIANGYGFPDALSGPGRRPLLVAVAPHGARSPAGRREGRDQAVETGEDRHRGWRQRRQQQRARRTEGARADRAAVGDDRLAPRGPSPPTPSAPTRRRPTWQRVTTSRTPSRHRRPPRRTRLPSGSSPERTRPDPATLAALKTLKTTTVKIAGGPNAVSVGIENGFKAGFGPTAVKRLSGADRYAAEAINLDAFGSSATVYLASGVGFPDALVGAALAGTKGSPVYLTGPGCVVPTFCRPSTGSVPPW